MTTLDKSSFATKDIMTVSGHRHAAPLQAYMGVPDISRRHQMSDALHEFGQGSLPAMGGRACVPAIEGPSRPPKNGTGVALVSCGVGSDSDDSRAVVPSQAVLKDVGVDSNHDEFTADDSRALVPSQAVVQDGIVPKQGYVHDVQLAGEMSNMSVRSCPVTAAASKAPDSPTIVLGGDASDGEICVTENVLQCSQTSVNDGSVTTNTAVSVERRVKGSLFAGAHMENCVFNITVSK